MHTKTVDYIPIYLFIYPSIGIVENEIICVLVEKMVCTKSVSVCVYLYRQQAVCLLACTKL